MLMYRFIISAKEDIVLKVAEEGSQQRVLEWLGRQKGKFSSCRLKDSQHLRCQQYGFEIEYDARSGKLMTLFAYFRIEKMGKFEGVLPYGVNEKWSLRNTIMYLGEPHTKSKHIVEIIYPALGLGLVFKGGWSQEDNLIDYGYFYEKEYESIQCAGCAKNIKRYKLADKVNDDKRQLGCKCGIVHYCTPTCWKKHIGLHTIFCVEID